ncbi:cystatin-1-like [Pantherophis guttatus]|uniref:Cystatin-1-like n=1 Tax=Pantherophis guttatus TaxID=94885 RepID=A0ABM3YR65_PANGU|nr:cystatin-1-like [Pantherophis guttatus]XP_060538617.1 cystatin-1-like [Pantherophis guttatus]
MLSPELLMGIAGKITDLPANDPGVQEALAFAVEQYNQDRGDSPNYFKVVRVLMAQSQVETWVNYSLLTQLVKTTCKKIASWKPTYQYIQKCKRLREKQEKPNCFFKVRQVLSKMELAVTSCK